MIFKKKILQNHLWFDSLTFIASDFACFSKNDAVAVEEEEMEDVEEINTEGKFSCFASIRKKFCWWTCFAWRIVKHSFSVASTCTETYWDSLCALLLYSRGDKVSALTHTCPHKSLRKIRAHWQSPGWQSTVFSMMFYLVICKHRKSIVTHETKVTYRDEDLVSLDNRKEKLNNFIVSSSHS